MTREEILKLEPGPELDRLVAERVMGWKRRVEEAPPGCAYWDDDKGHLRAFEDPGGNLDRWYDPWRPSTDIAVAWEVLNRLLANDFTYNIGAPCPYRRGEDKDWQIIVWNAEGEVVADVRAPNICLLICRAVLLALGVDDEG